MRRESPAAVRTREDRGPAAFEPRTERNGQPSKLRRLTHVTGDAVLSVPEECGFRVSAAEFRW